MAAPAATTTSTSLTNTVKTFYDRVLIEARDPMLKYYQFGIKKPLPKGEGQTILWNQPVRLAKGFVLAAGTPTSTGNALSTNKTSAVIRQFGGVTIIEDLVDMTSITDVGQMAYERLGVQAGETIERVIVNELAIGTTSAGIHIVKNSASIGDYFESISGVSVCSDGTAPGSVLGATGCYANLIAVSNIRAAVYRLKRMNVPPYEGNDYVAIVNTETAEDLVTDSTWINFHQYAAPGQENLYTGEIGKIYGCRFVETTQGPAVRGIGDSLSTASAIVYGTLVMGKGYFGVTELDGGITTYTVGGPSKSDPLNQTTYIGWKANFIAKVLNASCGLWFWAGSGETTTVGDESATGSPLRYKYPTSY